MTAQPLGFIKIALAEGRPPATFSVPGQDDIKAGRLEDLHRGNGDVWLVVADKSVVPENDATAQTSGVMRTLLEPAIKPFTGKSRHFAFFGQSGKLGRQVAQQP